MTKRKLINAKVQNALLFLSKQKKTAKTLDYKSFVIRKLKLKSAWRKGPLPKAKILKGHKENVSLIQINEDLLITLSWDRTIKIWNKGSTKPRYISMSKFYPMFMLIIPIIIV